MNRDVLAVFLLLSLFISAGAFAQTEVQTQPVPPPSVPIQTPPMPLQNLATALATARPASPTLALAVDADSVNLSQGMTLPHAGASLAEIGDAYGRLVHRFGGATAIAPTTMFILNTNPSNPNPYDGMPTGDAFKFLVASLDSSQWQALNSEAGLGLSDLSSDQQRNLFITIFPKGTIKVQPDYQDGEPYNQVEERDVTQEMSQARIRLAQNLQIMLPIVNQANSYMGTSVTRKPGGPRRYQLTGDFYNAKDTIYGVRYRDEVPNAPKHGQLDWNLPALSTFISITGIKTVGDLVARAAEQTKIEIYADKHFEGRKLTFGGPLQSAPAGDLLRALAFCLTGTYRQVGPVFVLTDDLMGVGTRRQLLSEFEQDTDALRRKPLEDAGDKILTAHSQTDIHGFGDSLAITPEEIKAAGNNNPWDFNSNASIMLPLSKMTPDQQDAAKRMSEQFGKEQSNQKTTLVGNIMLQSQPTVQLLLPSVTGPIDMQSLGLWNVGYDLFHGSPQVEQAHREALQKQYEAEHAKDIPAKPALPPTPGPPQPTLAETLRPILRRAVLVSPKNAADVDTIVAQMKKIGLNQLWLKVFSNGVAAIPDTSLSASETNVPDVKTDKLETDILTEALKVTKGTGITVLPVLDLFAWSAATAPDVSDLNILGETSAQYAARQDQRNQDSSVNSTPQPPTSHPVYVSPFAPRVQRGLAALVKALLKRPGIASLIWRETAPPGYDTPRQYGENGDNLGYTEPARLAFLRKAHVDPIDLGANSGKGNTQLPNFDDYQVDDTVDKQWRQYRNEANIAFLRALYAAASVSDTSPRILIKQRRQDNWQGSWYGTWDRPTSPLPSFHNPWEDTEPGQPQPPQQDPVVQAKSQSRLAMLILPPWGLDDAGSMASTLTQSLKGKPWDGFVIDLSSDPSNPSASQGTLARLAASLTKK